METALFPQYFYIFLYIYSFNNHCYSAGHRATPFAKVFQGSKLDRVSVWALGMENVGLVPAFATCKPQILRQITLLSPRFTVPICKIGIIAFMMNK